MSSQKNFLLARHNLGTINEITLKNGLTSNLLTPCYHWLPTLPTRSFQATSISTKSLKPSKQGFAWQEGLPSSFSQSVFAMAS